MLSSKLLDRVTSYTESQVVTTTVDCWTFCLVAKGPQTSNAVQTFAAKPGGNAILSHGVSAGVKHLNHGGKRVRKEKMDVLNGCCL